MPDPGPGERLTLSFGPGVAEVDEATRTLRRFLKTRGVGREGLDVLLLFREAALNAALHGLQHAPGGKAEAEIALEGGAARIRIQDPGPGFDWRSASFDAPHPEAESGRGLFVIAANADRVAFNESGNAIELYKHLGEQP